MQQGDEREGNLRSTWPVAWNSGLDSSLAARQRSDSAGRAGDRPTTRASESPPSRCVLGPGRSNDAPNPILLTVMLSLRLTSSAELSSTLARLTFYLFY
jgi:hypothetical protein